jgi:protein-L-isoaspartate O-methyltransferase
MLEATRNARQTLEGAGLTGSTFTVAARWNSRKEFDRVVVTLKNPYTVPEQVARAVAKAGYTVSVLCWDGKRRTVVEDNWKNPKGLYTETEVA